LPDGEKAKGIMPSTASNSKFIKVGFELVFEL
jgi:hypothetical protein